MEVYINEKIIIIAVENNNFEMVKWMHENKFPINNYAIITAINNENFEMVKWMHKNKFPINKPP